MSLEPGRKLLQYRIVERIGEGAMGVVYRALDDSLGREVAIKVLPDLFQSDPERLNRFEREARTLAALTHPEIAAIYGLHEKEGIRFLAMELAAGEDLAVRLSRGPMPDHEALPIASKIAMALDYAHDRGIVHRDLKPANIKIAPDGQVKVLDFGLAKAIEGDPTTSGPKKSQPTVMPTVTSAGQGTILGTAAYMSPEQARGQQVDRRTDVWAFGCLVYEMLTSRRAFPGDTVSDTLASVLRAEPDYTLLPPSTPESVRRMLRRCLVKDASHRLRSVADAAVELDDAFEEKAATDGPGRPPNGSRRLPFVWIAGALALGIVATLAAGRFRSRGERLDTPRAPRLTFRQLTFQAGGEGQPTVAPDGESFAYVKQVGEHTDVFLQRIDGRNPLNLTAGCTENDAEPAFSPDGKQIAIRSECNGGGIFVMGATGESSRRVTDFGHLPSWSPDGHEIAIVTEAPTLPSARNSISQLFAVRVETGERRLVSQHDAMHPNWSLDGRRIAFWGLRGDTSQRDLWTVSSDGTQAEAEAAVSVTEDPFLDWNPVWSPDGSHLYFSSTRGGTFNLWRIAIDPATGKVGGDPEAVTAPSSWAGWLSMSRDGRRIVFVDRNARTSIVRAPIDSSGHLTGSLQTVPIGSLELAPDLALSPDGRQVAFSTAGLPQHLFVVNADGSGLRQLTDGAHRDRQPDFSPDGEWIAFQTDRFPSTLALIRTDGGGLRTVAAERGGTWFPRWSLDGRQLTVSSQDGAFTVPVSADGSEKLTALPPAPAGSVFWPNGWSPDGKRLAGTFYRDGTATALAVLSTSDGSYATLSMLDAQGPRFTADGRQLILGDGKRLFLDDLATHRFEDLAVPSPGRTYVFPTLSADRRWLGFAELGDESDIWLASGEEDPPEPTH